MFETLINLGELFALIWFAEIVSIKLREINIL